MSVEALIIGSLISVAMGVALIIWLRLPKPPLPDPYAKELPPEMEKRRLPGEDVD